jgi:putative ABC transport system substrate-binding protein
MDRRTFIMLLGAAVPPPVVITARAQTVVPVVGVLRPGSPDDAARVLNPFRDGLKEMGFIEGQNVLIDARWAQGNYDQLRALADELVRRPVAVIAVTASMPSALAAKAATSSIPIVFSSGTDPVAVGLVESFNRPGGNVTGINYLSSDLAPKRLGLLHELVPGVGLIAVLLNKNNPNAPSATAEVQEGARQLGRTIEFFHAGSPREIDTAFASLLKRKAAALLLVNDALLTGRRVQIATLAARHGLPAIYTSRDYADAGGLMSYGANIQDAQRQVGAYVGRILKGEKPADLPIARSTKFEFVINLQTARTLNIDVPTTLLARADEVIE